MAQLPAWHLAVPGVAAHRGGSHEGPENTLYGMLVGLAAGATHLEIDVRSTADDTPIIFHDETAQRTCLTDGVIEEMTAEQVRGLDPCRLWSDLAGIATGERDPPHGFTQRWFQVPTLEDVLSTFSGVPVILDLKETAPTASVADVLDRWNRTDDLILAGYEDEVILDVADRVPDVPRGSGYQGTMDFFEGRGNEADAIIVPLEHEGLTLVDEGYVEQAHEENKAFWVWTINAVDLAKDLFEMGVDGIITDEPTKMSRLRLERLQGQLG